MASKIGRPAVNADTPLKPSERRYVEAIARGVRKIDAWKAAGFDPNGPKINDRIYRMEKRPNMQAALHEARLQANANKAVPMVEPLPLPENAEITDAWMVQQGHYLFLDAIQREDTDAALKCLTFMNRVGKEPRGPGRPPAAKEPNKNDLSGNYGNTNPNPADARPSPQDDYLYADTDDGDGAGDSSWDAPFFRKSAERTEPVTGTGNNRPRAAAERRAEPAGGPGDQLSWEAEGE